MVGVEKLRKLCDGKMKAARLARNWSGKYPVLSSLWRDDHVITNSLDHFRDCLVAGRVADFARQHHPEPVCARVAAEPLSVSSPSHPTPGDGSISPSEPAPLDDCCQYCAAASVRKVISRSKFTEQIFLPVAEQNF